MRHRPGFWWAIAAAAVGFGNIWRESGPIEMLLTLGGALACLFLFFPWWRRLARRNPASWSWYQPELLAEPEEMHPHEPGSNVHRLDE